MSAESIGGAASTVFWVSAMASVTVFEVCIFSFLEPCEIVSERPGISSIILLLPPMLVSFFKWSSTAKRAKICSSSCLDESSRGLSTILEVVLGLARDTTRDAVRDVERDWVILRPTIGEAMAFRRAGIRMTGNPDLVLVIIGALPSL